MEAWVDGSMRVVCNPPVYLLAETYREDGGEIDTTPIEAMVARRSRAGRRAGWTPIRRYDPFESLRNERALTKALVGGPPSNPGKTRHKTGDTKTYMSR